MSVVRKQFSFLAAAFHYTYSNKTKKQKQKIGEINQNIYNILFSTKLLV